MARGCSVEATCLYSGVKDDEDGQTIMINDTEEDACRHGSVSPAHHHHYHHGSHHSLIIANHLTFPDKPHIKTGIIISECKWFEKCVLFNELMTHCPWYLVICGKKYEMRGEGTS